MRTYFPKRLFYSLLVVMLWLSFVVEGAHALFQDTASLTGTTLTTGTVGLLISNSQNPSSTIYEHSRPGFSAAINPGESVERYFLLKNASQADIPLNIDGVAALQVGNQQITTATRVAVVPVDETGLPTGESTPLTISNANGPHSAIFATIPQGGTQRFKLITSLDAAYDGQNQTIAYDLLLTGTQKVSP